LEKQSLNNSVVNIHPTFEIVYDFSLLVLAIKSTVYIFLDLSPISPFLIIIPDSDSDSFMLLVIQYSLPESTFLNLN